MVEIKVTDEQLISSIANSSDLHDIEKFISGLVDFIEGYGYDFRERVINRLKEDT